MSNDNMKAKTHNNECLLFAVIFLSMLIVLAIVCVAVMQQRCMSLLGWALAIVCVAVMAASVSGVIFSSVLCIALTVLTVVSVAIIYSQYK